MQSLHYFPALNRTWVPFSSAARSCALRRLRAASPRPILPNDSLKSVTNTEEMEGSKGWLYAGLAVCTGGAGACLSGALIPTFCAQELGNCRHACGCACHMWLKDAM